MDEISLLFNIEMFVFILHVNYYISKNNSWGPERQVRLMHKMPKTWIANQDGT